MLIFVAKSQKGRTSPISDTALLDDPATLKEYAKFLGMFGTGIVDVTKEEVS